MAAWTAPAPKVEASEYGFMVAFVRDHADDVAINDTADPAALVSLLASELQDGFTRAGIAGSFHILYMGAPGQPLPQLKD